MRRVTGCFLLVVLAVMGGCGDSAGPGGDLGPATDFWVRNETGRSLKLVADVRDAFTSIGDRVVDLEEDVDTFVASVWGVQATPADVISSLSVLDEVGERTLFAQAPLDNSRWLHDINNASYSYYVLIVREEMLAGETEE